MTEIRNVAVAGSGTMGAGIAIVAARGGFTTTVYDTSQASLDRARDGIESFFDKSVQRGKLKPDQVDHILDRLVYSDRIDALAPSDLVIEAVFEDMGVKHALYQKLDARNIRSSRRTPPRSRSPSWRAAADATTASSACTSACRRS